MKKLILLFVFGTAFNSMALSGFTYKYVWKAGDTVTFTKLKTNDDSTRIWSNRVGDTLKIKMNYNQVFHNHDSIFTWTNIDTISGKVRMDTIVDLDSVYSAIGSFTSCRAGEVITNYIQMKNGAGSKDSIYIDTTCYDSLYHGATYEGRALIRIVQRGAIIVIYQPKIIGSASGDATLKGIPSKFIFNDVAPGSGLMTPAIVVNNGGGYVNGSLYYATASEGFLIQNYAGSIVSGTDSGIAKGIIVLMK
jgi:hypothetical protein